MTERFAPLLQIQLAMLDSYESQLATLCDEATLNEAIKNLLKAMLPVIRAQNALGEQMVALHREQLAQYRQWLESAMSGRLP
jgi:hypothetical protein